MEPTITVKNCENRYVEIPYWNLAGFLFDVKLDKYNFKEEIIDKYRVNITDLFRKCCLYNLLRDAQLIHELFPGMIEDYIRKDNEYFFEAICSHNHDNEGYGEKFNLEVMKWLINYVDLKTNYQNFLLSSVHSTKTIKFLFRYGANIYFDDDKLFVEACKIQNTNLMYWLYDRGVDVRARDDEAFRTACLLNHEGIAIILCHMCDCYHLKGKEGKITYWKIEKEKIEPPAKKRKMQKN